MSGWEPWVVDSHRFASALAPYVTVDSDGNQYVSTDCPDELADAYRRFCQYLYANGLA